MKITKFNLLISLSLLFFGIKVTAQNDISFIKLIQPDNNTAIKAATSGFSTEKVSHQVEPVNQYRVDEWIAIGDASSPWGSYNYPIDFYWNTSLTQSIYTADQINHVSCAVEKLLYTYKTVSSNYPDTIDTEHIRVWMANTNRESLSEADEYWMPLDQFTLVYDDTISFYQGVNHELIFNLSQPFVYSGLNLCIMVEHIFSENSYENHFNFVASTLADGDIKTRLFSSYEASFDFTLPTTDATQTGMTLGQIADISLGITSSEGGNLSGTITNNDGAPIANATIAVANTDLITTSNADGAYTFPYLSMGDYTINVSAFGYISNSYDVAINGSVTQDIVMEYLSTSTVEGLILDQDNVPIAGATIQISGYASLETMSDANGNFTFADVFYSADYVVTFSKNGFDTQEQSLIVNEANTTIPTIYLTDILESPSKVEAVKNGTTVDLSWLSPYERTVYRRDGGELVLQIGHNYNEEMAVFGQVYREPAKLYQMSWYTNLIDNPHDFVNVFVFALDNNGNPTNTVIYETGNVPNIDLEWSSFTFPDTIIVESGFYIAVSYNGRLELGIDGGQDPKFPFVYGVNWASEDYGTGEFVLMEDVGLGTLPGNLMIRAEGYNLNTGKKLQPTVGDSQSKTLNAYNVYRLKSGDEDVMESWTLLEENTTETQITDNTLIDMDPDWYRYAITAVYSGGNTSEPAFSKPIENKLTTQITFNISTNTTENESIGAEVTVTNVSEGYSFSKTVTNIDGTIVFENIFKDIYDLAIQHPRFESLYDSDLDFTTNATYSANYELIELLGEPDNLNISVINDTAAYFNWNHTANLVEDFELCDNFAINPEGIVNWKYIDGDNRPTIGISNFEYLNENAPHAFMSFNPTATQPPIDIELNPVIAPHSGTKFLASFGVDMGVNDDYFISPELNFSSDFEFSFWAKSLEEDPAPNKIMVGYSTTGSEPEDFIWFTESPIELASNKWTNYAYSVIHNTKHLCIHNVSDGGTVLMIDDVEVYSNEAPKGRQLTNYEVYLNDVLIAEPTDDTFMFTSEHLGLRETTTYTAGVKAIYDSGESAIATVDFTIETISITDELQGKINVYPNPSNGLFTIELDGTYEVSVFNNLGKVVYTSTVSQKGLLDLSDMNAGIYYISAKSDKKITVQTIVIK